MTTDPALLEDIFRAYYDARRNKRNTPNQLRFEMNLERNLVDLYNEILRLEYKVGRSISFIVHYPVKREIFAANFRDRVVHHLLFNYIAPIFERTFIHDCYSCRKGKGTLYGIQRLEHNIRSATRNYTQRAYILKLDLMGYFMNINRDILYKKVEHTLLQYASRPDGKGRTWSEVLNYERVLYLCKEIIYNDPTENCFIRGAGEEWEGLPPSKSLFHSPKGCGLPIGNLTSQLFSNVYLSDFDNFIKRDLKQTYYGRYVDDFYIINQDKMVLVNLIGILGNYLEENLKVSLHPKKIHLQTADKGVNFLGATVKPYRRYVVKKTRHQFNVVMNRYNTICRNADKLSPAFLSTMRSAINSYLGYMSYYKSYKFCKKVIERCPHLTKYGYFQSDYRKFIMKPVPSETMRHDPILSARFTGKTADV